MAAAGGELLAGHLPRDGLRGPERADQVDVDDRLELLVGQVEEPVAPVDARAVHEPVDAPELLDGRRHHRLDVGAVGDVAGRGAHPVAVALQQRVLRRRAGDAVREHDARAALEQHRRGGEADAAPAAGDDDRLTGVQVRERAAHAPNL